MLITTHLFIEIRNTNFEKPFSFSVENDTGDIVLSPLKFALK